MRVRRPQLEKRMYKAASVGLPHSVRLNSPEKVFLASRSLHFSRKKPFGGPKGFLRRKSPSFLATADKRSILRRRCSLRKPCSTDSPLGKKSRICESHLALLSFRWGIGYGLIARVGDTFRKKRRHQSCASSLRTHCPRWRAIERARSNVRSHEVTAPCCRT